MGLAPVSSIAQPASSRAFAAASPWGTDHWRHSKAAFKDWTKAAVAPGVSREKREFFGFCALAFGDVDTDKDGFINLEEFDRLLESVAAVPRRYGLAPVSTMSTLERQMAHKKLFDQLISKIGKVPAKDVGLYQVQDYTEEQYIGFVERAVNNPGSYEHASFYNFILNCFVEADEQCEGRITYDQFDKLLTRAATVPRHFGLAPPESSVEARKKMFDELELKRGGQGTGYVTARTFWEWTVVHVRGMIELQKAGKGWRENQ